MAITNCKYFNGYKPCGYPSECNQNCEHKEIPSKRILVVHLGALGAVLRSTTLLKPIQKKYPGCHITWVTESPADQLLYNNPIIDKVLPFTFESMMELSAQAFDVGFCIDKSLKAIGLMKQLRIKKKFGFTSEESGAIVPLTNHANKLWEIGLDNHLKFNVNQKTECQLITESLNLIYERDPYLVTVGLDESEIVKRRRRNWLTKGQSGIIGINTGCASTIPHKKLSIDGHRALIREIQLKFPKSQIVLLGGREDVRRSEQISLGMNIILSPMLKGVRDGLLSVGACDVVVSGDSLGMHMAIALKKWVVAWFGPTCAHEIDLFDWGVKVVSKAQCGPCWKRECRMETMCYDQVDYSEIISGIRMGLGRMKKSDLFHEKGSTI